MDFLRKKLDHIGFYIVNEETKIHLSERNSNLIDFDYLCGMSVAVVILNYNGRKFLADFLPIVLENTQDATIYVADNGSSDDSLALLAADFPSVSVLSWAENLGYAGGYNFALGQIKADYFVLMNSDIAPRKNWLPPLVAYFEANNSVAAAQPFLLDYHKPDYFEYAGAAGGFWDSYGYPFCRGRLFDTLEKNEGQYATSVVNWATGACLMVRAEAFHKVGGLDPYLFAHMEEIDLCWRMQRAGYSIAAVAESEVLHVGGGTLNKENPFKTYLNFRNNLILLYKNLEPSQRFSTIFVRMLLDGIAGLKFLTEGKLGSFIAILKAHFGFYHYLFFVKEKQNLSPSLQKSWVKSFEGSILKAYFLQGKKKFNQIKF
jgi:GT2 family glycosyltransferase